MPDHYLVEAKMIVAKGWCGRAARCKREVIRVEELRKPEKKQVLQEKVGAVYERVKESSGRVEGCEGDPYRECK